MNNEKDRPKIIAVCGKGGVGKTSISALIIKLLIDSRKKVLAIDADPAIGLSSALNIEIEKTIDDIRNEIITRIESKETSRADLIREVEYHILASLKEGKNYGFTAIGRPEGAGCYCSINQLLKDVIQDVARNFDYVVIDGEAGIEQVNRRVMERVTHLVLISDLSARGLNVAASIQSVADKRIKCDKIGLVLNRVHGEDEVESLAVSKNMNPIGWLPEDDTIRRFDIQGRSLFELPPLQLLKNLNDSLERLGI